VTTKGLWGYSFESRSEDATGPACNIAAPPAAAAPIHYVVVRSKRRKYGVRVFAEGTCANAPPHNHIAFVVGGGAAAPMWTHDLPFSTVQVTFDVATIVHQRSGPENIHVAIHEQAAPASTKTRIDQRDVIIPITAQ
jgi:hypothetical protein